MNRNIKNGPIHFYTTPERESSVDAVVEYCIQLGERQSINRSQASYLISKGDVTIDGRIPKIGEVIPHGTWQLSIRNKNHHLVVYGAPIE
jgi:hypothetical protein